MEYISSVQAAEKWGVTPTRVTILAKSGLIPGAKQMGSRWMIPEDAQKPRDGRTKAVKSDRRAEPFFRYPAFEDRGPETFSPPLMDEERRIKTALECVYGCRFGEEEKILPGLLELSVHSADRYRRIIALRLICMVCISVNNGELFLDSYGRLKDELQGDFPHKEEMTAMLHELDATLGDSSYFQKEFRVIPLYAYHVSFLPHLAALSAISLFYTVGKAASPELINTLELNCALVDASGYYADQQTLHLYLGCIYALQRMGTESAAHLRRALELAEKHELYHGIAAEYFYMPDVFEPVLGDFSQEFKNRLQYAADELHFRYARFMDAMSVNTIFKLILHDEYIYVLYAAQGLSDKEVASRLNVSERTVGKRYSEIYDTVGVKSKKELVEFISRVQGKLSK